MDELPYLSSASNLEYKQMEYNQMEYKQIWYKSQSLPITDGTKNLKNFPLLIGFPRCLSFLSSKRKVRGMNINMKKKS